MRQGPALLLVVVVLTSEMANRGRLQRVLLLIAASLSVMRCRKQAEGLDDEASRHDVSRMRCAKHRHRGCEEEIELLRACYERRWRRRQRRRQ